VNKIVDRDCRQWDRDN